MIRSTLSKPRMIPAPAVLMMFSMVGTRKSAAQANKICKVLHRKAMRLRCGSPQQHS